MKLKILSSGSQGNGYILYNQDSALIIECGVSLKEVKEALDFNIFKVEAAICSHAHFDHAGKVKEYLQAGIPVYGSKDIYDGFLGARQLKDRAFTQLKSFSFQPFLVKHDVENFCLLIYHEETGLVLYATDCQFLPYRFKGLNNMMIEANYDLNILDENIQSGSLPVLVRNRVIQSHMSFDTVKEMLKVNDIKAVNNIVLIHLSSGNSDARKFKTEIEALTGKRVTIAEKGIEIEFNKEM